MIRFVMWVTGTLAYFGDTSANGPNATMIPFSMTSKPSRTNRAASASRPTCFQGSSSKSKNVPRTATVPAATAIVPGNVVRLLGVSVAAKEWFLKGA